MLDHTTDTTETTGGTAYIKQGASYYTRGDADDWFRDHAARKAEEQRARERQAKEAAEEAKRNDNAGWWKNYIEERVASAVNEAIASTIEHVGWLLFGKHMGGEVPAAFVDEPEHDGVMFHVEDRLNKSTDEKIAAHIKELPPGPCGPEGPRGLPGHDAAPLMPRGTYSPNRNYARLDVVAKDGSSFLAVVDQPGDCSGSDWQPLAEKDSPGPQGPCGVEGPMGMLPLAQQYVHQTVCYRGDVRTYAGALWQARHDTARPPGDVEDWACLARAGVDGEDAPVWNPCGTYNAEATYNKYDVVICNGGSFLAKVDRPGPCPSDDWQMLSSRGKQGPAGPRGERGPIGVSLRIVGWEHDIENFRATPMLSDGTAGAPLDLRPYIQRYHDEAGGQ